MNAIQANTIALSELLSKLGHRPEKERDRDLLYRSPFREERTPSFHVDVADNLWFDFGEEQGGDVVDFASAYLHSRGLDHGFEDALRFLANIQALTAPPFLFGQKIPEQASGLILKDTSPLRLAALRTYLPEARNIPTELARKYLMEVEAYDPRTGKVVHSLGMRNADGGYEIRTDALRGYVGTRDVSVIRGKRFPVDEVHVFEGFTSLLSALAERGLDGFGGDVIVLHSFSCLSLALPYIENYESYERLFCWLGDDRAGEKAAQFLKRIAARQKRLEFIG